MDIVNDLAVNLSKSLAEDSSENVDTDVAPNNQQLTPPIAFDKALVTSIIRQT